MIEARSVKSYIIPILVGVMSETIGVALHAVIENYVICYFMAVLVFLGTWFLLARRHHQTISETFEYIYDGSEPVQGELPGKYWWIVLLIMEFCLLAIIA